VARKGASKGREPLPPPLPPKTRTVGQLVAETINLYRRRFWASLALGLGPAAGAVGLTLIPGLSKLVFGVTAFALLMTVSYLGGGVVTTGPAERQPLLVGVAVGYFVFDSTMIPDGLHTIAWQVTDNAGHSQGIGSRFFTFTTRQSA